MAMFGILLHVVVKMVDIQEALLRIHQYSDKKHSKNLNKKNVVHKKENVLNKINK